MIDTMRLRIETLVKLAKITTDVNMRERYVAEAYGLVQELASVPQGGDVGRQESTLSTFESFIDNHIVKNNKSRLYRKVIFDKYQQYCQKKGEDFFTSNTFYKLLRSRGFHEAKCNGYATFYVDFIEEGEDD